ncbi:DNA-binding GntR family transcriptional regulator [Spinactinospora alkalitolerans]|uniref:DNA-binding GntR family transcriptional regulator n=1 Tax=Spinactinospora alkalitolerans TaxID=687207 RepID=A0A852TN32_9ACTN|nr:GntR family transcriptional regulator [Spinactinospora alkalitolerans]NYE45348.1 DNA-binding GntR family transcriptional regulator [Spinactinospora alkalitolerans]
MSTSVNDPAPESPEAPVPLGERAYTAIRDLVITLEIPPGAVINEERLSRRLGIGRTPVRNAIKRLETERLVAVFPRRGTFATEINITDHALIADVRRELEGLAARRAAQRATPRDRADLARLRDGVAEHGSAPESVMRLDTEVHRALYRATRNAYLESTLGQYYNHALRIWYLFLDRLPDVGAHVAEHRPLLDAVVSGEAETAHALAVEHVNAFERTVRDLI